MGVALATTQLFKELNSFLLLQSAHWQACTWGSIAQATHIGAQMVCLGGLTGFPSCILENPLGKLVAEKDILFPLDGGP